MLIWSERFCAERLRRSAINHQTEIDAVVRQLLQVELGELLAKFSDEIGRVFRTDPECDQSPGVSEHGMPDVRFELMQVLVGDREAEAGTVSVRHRKHADMGVKPLDQFLEEVSALIASKSATE